MTVMELKRKLDYALAQSEAATSLIRAIKADLDADIQRLHEESRKAQAARANGESVECPCPPSARAATPTMGHPARTQCRLCHKEHE